MRPTRHQIDDLLAEIRLREQADERVLCTTLTKKMSEDLTDYLLESGVRARYLHSEIDTLERIKILRDLRLGEYDVLVGVNLLREGLDLPEVSLVAILDADKEGFLRGQTALIQTIGRAARNVNGKVLMYADKRTEAIAFAIAETDRRRAIQLAYNEEHGIVPSTIRKGVSDLADFLDLQDAKVPGRRRGGSRDVEGMGRTRPRAPDRRALRRDALGGRGAALRVRRQAARRDQGAAARARRGGSDCVTQGLRRAGECEAPACWREPHPEPCSLRGRRSVPPTTGDEPEVGAEVRERRRPGGSTTCFHQATNPCVRQERAAAAVAPCTLRGLDDEGLRS